MEQDMSRWVTRTSNEPFWLAVILDFEGVPKYTGLVTMGAHGCAGLEGLREYHCERTTSGGIQC